MSVHPDNLMDAIADLRGKIGHLEIQAATDMMRIQERADSDKNRRWQMMLDQTRDLRAHLSHFESDLTLTHQITTVVGEADTIDDDEYYAEKRRDLDKHHPEWREMKHPNGQLIFSGNGMMLDEKGNRSIFDDVDD